MKSSVTKDLLIEIGTEELPPGALSRLSESLAEGVQRGLEAQGLSPAEITPYATPRRLALWVKQVPAKQAGQTIERKGPALAASFDAGGRPTRAAQGFARSCGVTVEDLERLETEQGVWLCHRASRPGLPAAEFIAPVVEQALNRLPIPKRMRWGAGEAEFVRPVHWVVLLFGEELVEAAILGVEAGQSTYGHRFHHPEPIRIPAPADYCSLLEAPGKVIVDFQTRRERIRNQVENIADQLDGRALIEDDLLDEVTALTEWPVAMAGSFDAQFLKAPPEALISTMQKNQRYFAVTDEKGQLLPHFIFVANIESLEPEQVREGNERVIRPRFADAAFFWEQDRKTPLAARRKALEDVVFQNKLGSLFDKTVRVAALAELIAKRLYIDPQPARRAAELSKCDLLTDMVGEFPELQGIMGRYYALHDGESEAVAAALEEQYLPRQAGGALPRTGAGQVLAIADRLDTLVGVFAIGEKPSGEKDPFGLRRASLSVLRIVIECEQDLDLEELLSATAAGFAGLPGADGAVPEVLGYMLERLKAYYAAQGVAADTLDAVLARRPAWPLDFDRRVRAVEAFRRLPEAASLAAANKRIRNILRKSEREAAPRVDEALLEEPAEQALYREVEALRHRVDPLFGCGDYQAALTELARLREPVDRFFDEVLVMAEDDRLRNNRLALLDRLSELFLRAADLSRLQE